MRKALVVLLLAAFLLPSAFAADQPAKYNYNLSDYNKATGKTVTTFKEAPMLAKLVAEKKLPPVAQRLPKNPLVRIPMGEVGQYGGTIRWIEPSPVYSAIFRGFNLGALLNIPPSPVYTTETTDVQGDTDPGILESWSMSADGKTFTGKIREGLKWSDGIAVTTEDVEYAVKNVALNKEVNSVTPRWMNWGGKETKLQIVDRYTFRLTFAEPYGAFPEHMLRGYANGGYPRLLRPKHYYQKYHKDFTAIAKILLRMKEMGYKEEKEWGVFYSKLDAFGGSGNYPGVPYASEVPVLTPYLLVKGGDERQSYTRNPYYWVVDPAGNQLPYIDNINRTVTPDTTAYALDVMAGKSDFQEGEILNILDYPLLKENESKGNYNAVLLPYHTHNPYAPWFNLYPEDPVLRPIFQDIRFRRALSMALDRKSFNETIWLGTGTPGQIAPMAGSAYYTPGMEKNYAQYDVAAANALLEEMGLKWDANRQYRLRPDGKTLTIHFEVYHHRVYNAAAEVMRRYWEAVGVKVELDPSKDDFFNKFPQMEVSGIHLVPALTQTLYMQLAWTTPVWYNWMNTGGKDGVEPPAWAKELIKIGMEDLYKVPTRKEREALGKRAWQLVNENLPFIGVVADSKTANIFSKDLGNVMEAQKLNFSHDTVAMLGDTWYFKTPARRQ